MRIFHIGRAKMNLPCIIIPSTGQSYRTYKNLNFHIWELCRFSIIINVLVLLQAISRAGGSGRKGVSVFILSP